jgi:methyl-accepting chemotaxis protein
MKLVKEETIMMSALRNGLFLKLQCLLGVIGVVCLVMGVSIWSSEQEEQRLDGISENLMRKTAILEKVNGLVYAVVMESRGLYMSENPAQIDRFGKGMETHLKSLQTTINEWLARIDDLDRAKFNAFKVQADQFITLRTELVAEARAKGSAGARAVGDNEANRAVRTAFNKSLEALALDYNRLSDQIEAENEQKHANAALRTRLLLASILILVVGGWVWITKAIAIPFAAITQALRALSAGSHQVEVKGREREDEIGVIAQAIDAFSRASIERARLAEAQSLEDRQRLHRHDAIEVAIERFQASAGARVHFVANTSTDLHRAAAGMSTAAEETARQAEIVSEASQTMTSNIETLATAGDQLSRAIVEIADRMVEASQTAERASKRSHETTEKFSQLAEAVSKIGDVINLINQIANQTNLLALNATIEAARAGEAGRGFAVVASEVKQLAAQTTKATAEIAQSVTRVQDVASESIDAVRAINVTIEDMRGIATAVAAAVEEQRVSTQEIAANVQNSAQGSEQVASNIIGVSQAAAETGNAALSVLQSSSKLSTEAAEIQRDVETFLEAIRAA